MTMNTYFDSKAENVGKSLSLGFESSEDAMLAGIRARPADLARLFDVTKQTVSNWVKDGRIILGVDGRVDPRVAVSRLIATGDPARLRAVFLKPLVTELADARRRIAGLEQAVAQARDDAKFHEHSASEFNALVERFQSILAFEWDGILELPPEQGIAALLAWFDHTLERGLDDDVTILDMVDMAARSVAEKKEGEGDETPINETGAGENVGVIDSGDIGGSGGACNDE